MPNEELIPHEEQPIPPDAGIRIRGVARRVRPEVERAPQTLGILLPPSGRFDLSKLVLDEPTKRELVIALHGVQMRAEIEAAWQLSEIEPLSGRCILNFYGPPGTGKTRAAQAIGWRLQKPLYQVDYAAVISKYVGDTAKNIRQVFAETRKAGAVLFFDEADSLLSRRVAAGESCGSSINQNRNVLMQELDRHNDLVIVATNLFGNYDPALLRRISRHVQFRLPDRAMRRRIFELHLPATDRVDADLDECARISQGLSGGDIKVACLNAMLAASTKPDSDEWRVDDLILSLEIHAVIESRKAHEKGRAQAQ